jgi:hypothetical protein
MTALELKRHLMKTISEIDDEVFLNAIKTILDSKTSTKVLKLSLMINSKTSWHPKRKSNKDFIMSRKK